MREDTREQSSEVAILAAARAGQSLRRAGSDVARGETVMHAGSVVRAAEWGMLASLNQAEIEVRSQPRVGIITTGEELVAVGAEMSEGQIRDSNSFTLEGLARTTGALVNERQHVGDEHAPLEAVLCESAKQCDVIITSGGVSAGDFDPVRDVLQKIADVHFWKIAMKPGKPVMFATLKNGNRLVPVFGLPGNPVSVMVTFEQFVRPALLKMQSRRATRRIEVQATVDSPFSSPSGKVDFVRVLAQPDGDGWIARLTGDQSSGRLSTMTRSNALLVVPADVTRVEAGQKVKAQMTEWPEID
jgi:molybdopterin molybdotransferase